MWIGKLKRVGIVLLLTGIAFAGYVVIVNLHSQNMTVRQKILKAVYPLFKLLAKANGKNVTALSNTTAKPLVSFYTLKDTLNKGIEFDFASLKGKKVLLVNTASDCGYTAQYEDLQKLQETYGDKVTVIGFPANDF